ncbi:MAG: DUF1987 domain-containing protein [Bacteroidales bacterium]|nr:DUF1987 domain-containing protein [Bacteroidales bacterium]MBN2762624.1 DUF1987 domain-containing protein [Bacteroidales bacterium]
MRLHIPQTEKTPEVILDETQNLFQVKGNCLPENIRDFNQMVTEKLESYLRELEKASQEELKNKPFRVNFRLGYFNTAAAKFIADVLILVKSHIQKNSNIKIYWHYHEDDYDMLEAGEDMAGMVEVPMIFVMIAKP